MNIHDAIDHAQQAADVMKALAHPQRLLVLCRLSKAPAAVQVLQEELEMTQAAVSQLLARLRQQQLVATERQGQRVVYRVADPRITELLQTMARLYCKEMMQ